jgi:cold shock CspA family protein
MPKTARRWIKGIVDWFDDEKGQGFVRDEGGDWYYFHYSAIETNRKRKNLKSRQKVEFQVIHETFEPQIRRIRSA